MLFVNLHPERVALSLFQVTQRKTNPRIEMMLIGTLRNRANKLYNNYMVYDASTLTMHSLNRNEKYYFEVEAFDSGTDYYRERTEQTMGRGAEIELLRGREMVGRKMIVEGKNEYAFENILPGEYTFRHTFGPTMWRGELTEAHVIGSNEQATIKETLSDLGAGTQVLGKLEIEILPGKDSGKFIVTLNYDKSRQKGKEDSGHRTK